MATAAQGDGHQQRSPRGHPDPAGPAGEAWGATAAQAPGRLSQWGTVATVCRPCHQIRLDSEGPLPRSLSTLPRPLPALPVRGPPRPRREAPQPRAGAPRLGAPSLSRAAGAPRPGLPACPYPLPAGLLLRPPAGPAAPWPGAWARAGSARAAGGGCAGAARVLLGRRRAGLGFREGGRRRGRGGAGCGRSRPTGLTAAARAGPPACVVPGPSRPRPGPSASPLSAQKPGTKARARCVHGSSRAPLRVPASPWLVFRGREENCGVAVQSFGCLCVCTYGAS